MVLFLVNTNFGLHIEVHGSISARVGSVRAYRLIPALLSSPAQRAVPAAGHEMQQMRLCSDKGDEPDVSLFGAFGGRGEPEGLPQNHAAAQVFRKEKLCLVGLLLILKARAS